MQIPPVEQDGSLPARLTAAKSAVLAWAYQGWKDYTTEGLNPPKAVTARTEDYRALSDSLTEFLTDQTTCGPGFSVPAGTLFGSWSDWCKKNGGMPGSQVTFSESMQRRGIEKKRLSGGQTYLGLMLKQEAAKPEQQSVTEWLGRA